MADRPQIIITFDERGSSVFNVSYRGVNDIQIYLAAHFIAEQAHARVLAQMQSLEGPPLVPGNSALNKTITFPTKEMQ